MKRFEVDKKVKQKPGTFNFFKKLSQQEALTLYENAITTNLLKTGKYMGPEQLHTRILDISDYSKPIFREKRTLAKATF